MSNFHNEEIMKLSFKCLPFIRPKHSSQTTYQEEAADVIQLNNTEKKQQLIAHLIKMTPVITPDKNENIQRK